MVQKDLTDQCPEHTAKLSKTKNNLRSRSGLRRHRHAVGGRAGLTRLFIARTLPGQGEPRLPLYFCLSGGSVPQGVSRSTPFTLMS
jgi:hypothetical protein